jgi:AcrR family transcriptional regulator
MRRRSQQLPRKLPKQGRAKATVEAILTATAHILVRHGFEAASTNRIAERAGVSIGSLYQYFPSKDALVAALLERHVQEMLAVAQDGLARPMGESMRGRARTMVRVMLAAHAVEPRLHRVFMEEMPYANRMQRLGEMEQMFEELAKVALERERGTIRPRNLDIAAFILVQAVEALTHAAVLHRPELLNSEEFLEETTELIVRYLSRDRKRQGKGTFTGLRKERLTGT